MGLKRQNVNSLDAENLLVSVLNAVAYEECSYWRLVEQAFHLVPIQVTIVVTVEKKARSKLM